MCGRFVQRVPPEVIVEVLGTANALPNFPARFNAAPTDDIAVVRFDQRGGQRSLDLLRWGLVPRWAKDLSIGSKMINARADTLAEKPAFRDAFRRRRCIIPVDCFYEWRREGKAKQPYAIAFRDKTPMALAGLWENWRDPAGNWTRTFTIITTDANDLLRPLHDRMPVILPAEAFSAWLGERPAEQAELQVMLAPYPADEMELWPVSREVNSVKNQGEHLLERITLPEAGEPLMT